MRARKWLGAIEVGIEKRFERYREAEARLTPKQFKEWLKRKEQPFYIEKELLDRLIDPEMYERQKAAEMREAESEKEGERLSLQDRPRLDEEIWSWTSEVLRDVNQWVREDLEKISVEEILRDFDHMAEEYTPDWVLSSEYGVDPIIDTPQTKGSNIVINDSGVDIELYELQNTEYFRAYNNDLYLTRGKLRKMKELYSKTMVEMGLLESASEPKEVEEVPPDRGIEWVRAAFTKRLETLDEEIGIDFFLIEEIGGGRILVKGKGYLERDIWGALNDMVRRELGGRYDSSQRGWIIKK